MKYTLRGWSVARRPAIGNHPAFAIVLIRGMHSGLIQRQFKSETHHVPLDPNEKKNDNQSLVKQAIKLSKNDWSIPWGMNFK